MRPAFLRMLLVGLLWLPGCVDLSLRTQPVDTNVEAELIGEDCAGFFFGLGGGTITIERAMAKGYRHGGHYEEGAHQIKQIRSVELTESAFLFFGSTCVRVVGSG